MLEEFIHANRLSAKVFETTKEVHTAAKAAAEMEGDNEAVVKSIVLVGSDQESVLVILLGKDKIDLQKVKKVLGLKDMWLAEPKEVLERTGYEIGGVPPISIYGIKTIIDKKVLEKEDVVCGGGTPNHLMRIKVKEIMENVDDISVEDVKK